MRHALLMVGCSALLLGGCAMDRANRPSVAMIPEVQDQPQSRWETLVTPEDTTRLNGLPQVWTKARATVPARLKAKLVQEGALVDPLSALDLPTLPPGPYYCRLVRLGGPVPFVTYKPDFCTVAGTAHSLSFTKQSGSILPGGWLFADTDKRQVFLGTFRSAQSKSAPAYSVNKAQDVAGVVERVGPFRWRLVLTQAGGGALLDIYELVPITPRVAGAVPAVPG